MTEKSTRGIAGLTVKQLQAEIRRRERRVGALQRRRAKLAQHIAHLDGQISLLGGRSGGRRDKGAPRARPKNETKVLDAVRALLRNKTMQVREIASALLRAGHRTNAANFKAVVQQTLMNNKDAFQLVGRGRYRAS